MQWQSRFVSMLCMALARLARGIENAMAEPLRADTLHGSCTFRERHRERKGRAASRRCFAYLYASL